MHCFARLASWNTAGRGDALSFNTFIGIVFADQDIITVGLRIRKQPPSLSQTSSLHAKMEAPNLAACAAKALRIATRNAALTCARASTGAEANAASANDKLNILRLPNEIFLNIADNLDVEEMAALSLTCRRMQNMLDDRLYRDAMQPGVPNRERLYVPGGRPYDDLRCDHHLYTAAVRDSESLARMLEYRVFDDEECNGQPSRTQMALRCSPLHPEDLLNASVGARASKTTAILLDYGVSVRAVCPEPTQDDVPPLHMAILAKSSFLMNLLISRGASPDQCDGQGRTAIFLAVEQVLPEMVETLIHAGAYVDSFNYNNNVTPLCELVIDMNRQIDSHGRTYSSDHWKTAEILIATGANMTKSGALHWAAVEGDRQLELIKFMVKNGADVTQRLWEKTCTSFGTIKPTALETFEMEVHRVQRRAKSRSRLPRYARVSPFMDEVFRHEEERIRRLLTFGYL